MYLYNVHRYIMSELLHIVCTRYEVLGTSYEVPSTCVHEYEVLGTYVLHVHMYYVPRTRYIVLNSAIINRRSPKYKKM